jgi:hypothetical protein
MSENRRSFLGSIRGSISDKLKRRSSIKSNSSNDGGKLSRSQNANVQNPFATPNYRECPPRSSDMPAQEN